MSVVSVAFRTGLFLGLPFWVLVFAGLVAGSRGKQRCFSWPKLPRID